eukprot:UN08720
MDMEMSTRCSTVTVVANATAHNGDNGHDEEQKNSKLTAEKVFAVDLHVLMWKQSILIAVTLFTTLCTTAWVYILPMFTNLLVYDCIMNAICNHLMFSFCNPFWNSFQNMICFKKQQKCDN